MSLPKPIVHVLILAGLTSLTNASALAPTTFGGVSTTIALAVITLMVASLEHVVRKSELRRVPPMEQTKKDQDILVLHTWGCAIAAVASFFCAVLVITT